jgi:hypothetical protein
MTFKGTIDPTAPPPPTPAVGDYYFANKAATLGATWTGIAGTHIKANDSLMFDGTNWHSGPAEADLDSFVSKAGDTMTGKLVVPDVAVSGGTIDGTAIGGSTPAAGQFSDLATTGNLRAGTTTNSGSGVINLSSSGALRGDNTLYLDAVLGSVIIRPQGLLTVGTFSSTGLAVTGDLSCSTNLTVTGGTITTGSTTALSLATSGGTQVQVANTAANRYITLTGSNGSAPIIGTSAGDLAFSPAGTERMRIDSSGNVGIATSSPVTRLAVYGPASVTSFTGSNRLGVTVQGPTSTDDYAGIDFTQNNGAPFSRIASYFSGNGSVLQFGTSNNYATGITNTALTINQGGEVLCGGTTDQGAYNLQCNGTGVWGAGAYVNGSDARIKEDIAPIESGLDVVEKLNPVTYRYKEEWSKDQSTQTGFIAQELLTALEGQVYVDGVVQQGGEYMSVAYQNIIPILTKAIQELNAKVVELESKLNAK